MVMTGPFLVYNFDRRVPPVWLLVGFDGIVGQSQYVFF